MVRSFFQLRHGLLARFGEQLGLLDLVFEFGVFVGAILALAEFLLNGFELLIQVAMLALGFLRLAAFTR